MGYNIDSYQCMEGETLDTSINMVSGRIGKVLIKLAYPIILSNLVQTLFGLINMIWIGRLGSGAVSAIGTASFYINLGVALSTLITIGTGVRVAQTLGAKQSEATSDYIHNAMIASVILAVIFCVVMALFSVPFIAFYQLHDTQIETMAVLYLRHSLVGMPFMFLSSTLIAIMTSFGDSKQTFKANFIGLILNIILDPLFIFGFSFFPPLHAVGAAWSSNIARIVTFLILFMYASKKIGKDMHIKIRVKKILEVIKMSFPVTAQRVLFILISIYMAKIIVKYGSQAVAVQKIGVQIESISYVTIGGLQSAISAFVGQNYGAKNYTRIAKGFQSALWLVIVFGLVISTLFILFSKEIFAIFINEKEVIHMGVSYMNAIGFSQLFMCLELLSVGAFNGLSKTYIPPIISILLTTSRIPIAIYLSERIGLNGVWWSISITSILKGLILVVWYKIYVNKKRKEQVSSNEKIMRIKST